MDRELPHLKSNPTYTQTLGRYNSKQSYEDQINYNLAKEVTGKY